MPACFYRAVLCRADIVSSIQVSSFGFRELDLDASYRVDNGLYRIKANFYIAVKLNIIILGNRLVKQCRSILSIAETGIQTVLSCPGISTT